MNASPPRSQPKISAARQDGGPAYPHMMAVGHNDYAGGMSQRDWFAGQALASGMVKTSMIEYELTALFGSRRNGITREEVMAADAYRIADAMLARAALSAGNGDAK